MALKASTCTAWCRACRLRPARFGGPVGSSVNTTTRCTRRSSASKSPSCNACAPRASFDANARSAKATSMQLNRLVLVLAVAAASGCSKPAGNNPAAAVVGNEPAPAPVGADRKYLLERVEDAAVIQLYADGFDALPLREKTLIWHLSQAALAGRDIFIDQKHRDALEMRGVIDQIVAHPQGVDAAALAEIQRYAKLFWINNGPYNNLTARKFVLKVRPDALVAAAKAATQAGARIEARPGESLEAKL